MRWSELTEMVAYESWFQTVLSPTGLIQDYSLICQTGSCGTTCWWKINAIDRYLGENRIVKRISGSPMHASRGRTSSFLHASRLYAPQAPLPLPRAPLLVKVAMLSLQDENGVCETYC